MSLNFFGPSKAKKIELASRGIIDSGYQYDNDAKNEVRNYTDTGGGYDSLEYFDEHLDYENFENKNIAYYILKKLKNITLTDEYIKLINKCTTIDEANETIVEIYAKDLNRRYGFSREETISVLTGEKSFIDVFNNEKFDEHKSVFVENVRNNYFSGTRYITRTASKESDEYIQYFLDATSYEELIGTFSNYNRTQMVEMLIDSGVSEERVAMLVNGEITMADLSSQERQNYLICGYLKNNKTIEQLEEYGFHDINSINDLNSKTSEINYLFSNSSDYSTFIFNNNYLWEIGLFCKYFDHNKVYDPETANMSNSELLENCAKNFYVAAVYVAEDGTEIVVPAYCADKEVTLETNNSIILEQNGYKFKEMLSYHDIYGKDCDYELLYNEAEECKKNPYGFAQKISNYAGWNDYEDSPFINLFASGSDKSLAESFQNDSIINDPMAFDKILDVAMTNGKYADYSKSFDGLIFLAQFKNLLIAEAKDQDEFVFKYQCKDDFSINCVYNDEVSTEFLKVVNLSYNGEVVGITLFESDDSTDYDGTICLNKDYMMTALYSYLAGDGIVQRKDNGKLVINNDGKILLIQSKSDDEEGLFEDIMKSDYLSVLEDYEKQVFMYIYNTEGTDVAWSWLLENSAVLDKRILQDKQQEVTEWAEDHPVLASVGSFLFTPFEGFGTALYSFSCLITGNKIRQSRTFSYGDTWRNAVSNSIFEENGSATAFFYNIGMSMVDSLPLLAVSYATGGATIPTTIASVGLIGTRSYVSTLNNALARGLSDGEAVLLAFSFAAVETLSESFSVGHLINLEGTLSGVAEKAINLIPKISSPSLEKVLVFTSQILNNMISQGFCEGEEELFSSVTSFVLDQIISGNLSEYRVRVDSLIGDGKTISEALNVAFIETMDDWKLAFLGGLVSGGIFGEFSGVKTATVSMKIANTIMNNFENFQNADYNSLYNLIQRGEYKAGIQEILNNPKFSNVVKIKQAMSAIDIICNSNALKLNDIQKLDLKNYLSSVIYDSDLKNYLPSVIYDSDIKIDSLCLTKEIVNQYLLNLDYDGQAKFIDSVRERMESGERLSLITYDAIFKSAIFSADSDFSKKYLNYYLKNKISENFADKVSNIYENARRSLNDPSIDMSQLHSYCDHTEAHVLQVAFLSVYSLGEINIVNRINHGEYAVNEDYQDLFLAGILHDLGMAGADFINTPGVCLNPDVSVNSKTTSIINDMKKIIFDENMKDIADNVRTNHTLNSAVDILNLRDILETAGVNPDLIALLCFSHSKSNSGVGNLTSASDWLFSIFKIQQAVDSSTTFEPQKIYDGLEQIYNTVTTDSVQKLGKDVLTGLKIVTKAKFDSSYTISNDAVSKMATMALALRLGDAYTSKAKITLQNPLKWVYNGEQYTSSQLVLTQSGYYMAYDPTKTKLYVDKGLNNNFDTETGNYGAFTYWARLKNGTFVPCTREISTRIDGSGKIVKTEILKQNISCPIDTSGQFILSEDALMSKMGPVTKIINYGGKDIKTLATSEGYYQYDNGSNILYFDKYCNLMSASALVGKDLGEVMYKDTGQFLVGESNVDYQLRAVEIKGKAYLKTDFLVDNIDSFPYNTLDKGIKERLGELATATDMKMVVNVQIKDADYFKWFVGKSSSANINIGDVYLNNIKAYMKIPGLDTILFTINGNVIDPTKP